MTGLWCACRVNKYVELYHKHFGYSYTLSTSKAFRRQLIACPALSRPAFISSILLQANAQPKSIVLVWRFAGIGSESIHLANEPGESRSGYVMTPL